MTGVSGTKKSKIPHNYFRIYGSVQLESIIKYKNKHMGYDTEDKYLIEVINNLLNS